MQVSLQGQTILFLLCIALGGGMGLLYDALRLLRRLLPHTAFLIQLEDALYWLASLWFVFAALLRQNHGEIRFFILLGLLGGLGLYAMTLSRLVMAVGIGVLQVCKKILFLFFEILWTPFRLLWLPFRRPVTKFGGYCAKRGKNCLQLCKLYVKIKVVSLRRDLRFLRRKA